MTVNITSPERKTYFRWDTEPRRNPRRVSKNVVQKPKEAKPSVPTRKASFEKLFHETLFQEEENIKAIEKHLFQKLTPESALELQSLMSQAVKQYGALRRGSITTLSHILLRTQEIMKEVEKESFEKKAPEKGVKEISLQDAMKMALFIERYALKAQEGNAQFFGRRDTKLARSILVDKPRETVSILARHKIEKWGGTFKSGSNAITFGTQLLTKKPEVEAIIISRTKINGNFVGERDWNDLQQELAYLQKFQGKDKKGIRGVVKFRSFCNVSRKLSKSQKAGSLSIRKIAFVFKKYDSSLENVKNLNSNQKIEIAFDAIYGISAFHKKGLAHGDVKVENMLVNLRDKAFCDICDLGHTYKNGNWRPFQRGYYGTSACTPPELYGNMNFKGSDFKLDVWALGLALYQLHFNKEPEWMELIREDSRKNYDESTQAFKDAQMLQKTKEAFKNLVFEKIETPYKTLQEKIKKDPNVSQEEKFFFLICSMLRFNPAQRVSIDKALESIKKLFPNFK